MVKICIVEACKSEYYPDCGLSFHRLPKNETMRNKWLSIIPSGNRQITHNSVICSKHFKSEDYVPDIARPILKENTNPSLFLLPASKKIRVISHIQISAGSKSEPTVKYDHEYDEPIAIDPPSTMAIEPPNTMAIEPSNTVAIEPLKKESRTEGFKDVAVQTQTAVSCAELKRKIKVLNKKLRRRDKKIQDMKTQLSDIKKKSNNYDVQNMNQKNVVLVIHNFIN